MALIDALKNNARTPSNDPAVTVNQNQSKVQTIRYDPRDGGTNGECEAKHDQ